MSELLCFVTDKCNVLPVEGVKVCVDFYSESEIINARSAVDSTGMGGGTGGYRGYMYPPPFLEGGYKRVHSVKVCVYPVVR